MIPRRLRALSRGPTRLRPTVGTARRPCSSVGAPLRELGERPRPLDTILPRVTLGV